MELCYQSQSEALPVLGGRVKEGCLGTIGPKGSSTVYEEGALEGSVAKAEL